uniref:Uncharacterized protein n=1 Tax=Rhizophora mucronata TaxID=61149 RepID=A0A2P2Q513_RHIMU
MHLPTSRSPALAQAEITGKNVTSLGSTTFSHLNLERAFKQLFKSPLRENPEMKEFQETKSLSGSSSNNFSASFPHPNLK